MLGATAGARIIAGGPGIVNLIGSRGVEVEDTSRQQLFARASTPVGRG